MDVASAIISAFEDPNIECMCDSVNCGWNDRGWCSHWRECALSREENVVDRKLKEVDRT